MPNLRQRVGYCVQYLCAVLLIACGTLWVATPANAEVARPDLSRHVSPCMKFTLKWRPPLGLDFAYLYIQCVDAENGDGWRDCDTLHARFVNKLGQPAQNLRVAIWMLGRRKLVARGDVWHARRTMSQICLRSKAFMDLSGRRKSNAFRTEGRPCWLFAARQRPRDSQRLERVFLYGMCGNANLPEQGPLSCRKVQQAVADEAMRPGSWLMHLARREGFSGEATELQIAEALINLGEFCESTFGFIVLPGQEQQP